jgi:hypothetical protein
MKIEMVGRETRITYQRLEDNLEVEGMKVVDRLKMEDKSGEEGMAMVVVDRVMDCVKQQGKMVVVDKPQQQQQVLLDCDN